jgi:hypothetical protein
VDFVFNEYAVERDVGGGARGNEGLVAGAMSPVRGDDGDWADSCLSPLAGDSEADEDVSHKPNFQYRQSL